MALAAAAASPAAGLCKMAFSQAGGASSAGALLLGPPGHPRWGLSLASSCQWPMFSQPPPAKVLGCFGNQSRHFCKHTVLIMRSGCTGLVLAGLPAKSCLLRSDIRKLHRTISRREGHRWQRKSLVVRDERISVLMFAFNPRCIAMPYA